MQCAFHIDPPSVAQDSDEMGIQVLFRNRMHTLHREHPRIMKAHADAGRQVVYP